MDRVTDLLNQFSIKDYLGDQWFAFLEYRRLQFWNLLAINFCLTRSEFIFSI